MLRMFLVHASRQGRHDVVKEFFEKMTVALHDRKEWKDWFSKWINGLHAHTHTKYSLPHIHTYIHTH